MGLRLGWQQLPCDSEVQPPGAHIPAAVSPKDVFC